MVILCESCCVATYVKCSEDENRHFQQPHSNLTPPLQRNPANIYINLILSETKLHGLHLCQRHKKNWETIFGQLLCKIRTFCLFFIHIFHT